MVANWSRVRFYARRAWVCSGLLFMAWMVWSFQAHGVDPRISESDSNVIVTGAEGSWRFVPVAGTRSGLVFLPGGLVAPRAYFPLAHALANEGHAVVVVELPFRSAPTAASERRVLERARSAISTVGADHSWVLGGHSKGAAIATRLIERSDFQGLILLGTTHPRIDLSTLTVPVMKIGGTQDCVAPKERAEVAVDSLPAHTQWEWIKGANHAQFGWYGRQLMDCAATVSRVDQQAATVRLIHEFLTADRSAS